MVVTVTVFVVVVRRCVNSVVDMVAAIAIMTNALDGADKHCDNNCTHVSCHTWSVPVSSQC